MGKYSSRFNKAPPPRNGGVHPLMRGIGCIMMIIVPILAYGSAVLLVNYGASHGWPIPPNWLGTPTFHPLLWRLQGLATALAFLQTQTNLIANIVFAIAITVVIGGIMSMIYGYIYTLFGPPRYGPTDAPPERIKVKKYTR
ncbi:MAG: hypothetical protein L0287_33275 [Anaerolineae bacterium]|nr:hypothetical protein [Anaerolineae bacterium]MCI0608368.1 hypothetical protein [Anaerolineae bacterium]